MKFRPIQDRVIVRVVPERSAAGIELPPGVSGPHRTGLVLAVGDGMRFMDGQLHPVRFRAGDTVLFEGGEVVRIEGEELTMLRESQVVGIFERQWGVSSVPFKAPVESDVA